MIAAAFDVGTNTFLMVIGKYEHGVWTILHDAHSIARLGEGVHSNRRISDEAYKRAEDIAKQYTSLCRNFKVEIGYGVATSAVRDADNGQEICDCLSKVLGFNIQCISGEKEAQLSFMGTLETLNLSTVIDIGGGSTEYITGDKNNIKQRKSLQIGAVRIHERFFKYLPPHESAITEAREEIRVHLATLPQTEYFQPMKAAVNKATIGEIIGVGGTFTTLAALDLHLTEFQSERVHNHILSTESVSHITAGLLQSSTAELLKNPAIHPKRADILPAGALILEESLRFFDVSSCKASTKGLRYGVLYDIPRYFGQSI